MESLHAPIEVDTHNKIIGLYNNYILQKNNAHACDQLMVAPINENVMSDSEVILVQFSRLKICTRFTFCSPT